MAIVEQSEEQLAGLTFQTITEEQKASEANDYSLGDVVVSVALGAVIIGILLYFTG